MSGPGTLFDDPEFLRKLAYLDLVAKQILSGARGGERRSAARGAGTLFRDHRSYSRGDDLRYVDWNIYGRLGSLFVKEFEVEESANVVLFLDRSLSMDFGTPTKLDFARRVAGALGYIALSRLDRVEVVDIPGGESRAFSGRRSAPALFKHLLSLRPGGETDLLASVRQALAGTRRRGVVILVSDLLDRRGFRPSLDFLRHRRHQVFLVQVFAREEADPDFGGSLRLVDAESGGTRDVLLTEELRGEYLATFRRFCARVARYAREKEIGHVRFRSDRPFGEAVLSMLRLGGVVR